MSIASKVLNGSFIEYYVYWGTLLGVLRDHDFIRSDDDVDIIVNRSTPASSVKLLIDGLLANDFKFVHVVRTKRKNLYITFKYKGVHIDFFFYDEDERRKQIVCAEVYENHSVKYENENQCSTRYIRMPWCKPGSFHDFKGLKLSVPFEPMAALACAYGPNWRKPMPGWKTPGDYYEYSDELAQRYTDLSDVIL